MVMFYIKNDSLDPRFNLALEEYVVKYLDSEDTFVLLWQNEPSVIIGRFQNTVEEINTEYIEKKGINVVRRITGGGAVYHDLGNLNFSFIEKTDADSIDFRKYNERIVLALEKLGIKAEHNSRNDIAIEGKKFSGNAQFIYKGKVLHHGTILFNSNLEDVQAALRVNADKFTSKGVKSVRSRVTNVSDYLKEMITIEEFKEILLQSLFAPDFPVEYKLREEDLKAIYKLKEEKYDTWEWNYGSSPAFNFRKEQRFPVGKIDLRLDVNKGLINKIKIYGDFFGTENLEELENLILGCKYDRQEIRKKLENVDFTRYFGNINREELLSLFFD